MQITLVILAVSAVFFALGRVRSDIVALCALILLLFFGILGAIDKPCGESVRRLTQKHVAKRYMIAEKLLSLHHESYQQYKYV